MARINRIGYACTPIALPYRTSRGVVLKNFNSANFKECASKNIQDLSRILQWNAENNIAMFRISSDIIPFGSHSINNIRWWKLYKEELEECGRFIKNQHIRVSMHPGQYTILNSQNEQVVEKSIADLEYHCKVLDTLGVDFTNKIVLHIGGVYGDKQQALHSFKRNFARLSESVKNRLVLENDDKNYSIDEVVMLCGELDIPAVFDNLHHEINSCSLTLEEILKGIQSTWKLKDGTVKLHYSEQDIEKKLGAHSKTVHTTKFLDYIQRIGDLAADVMLEVKDKEMSALKCIGALDTNLSTAARSVQWAKYKYSIMEKSYADYKKCSVLVNSCTPMRDVYMYMDECLGKPFDEGNFKNTVRHVYGYIKKYATLNEKERLNQLMEKTTIDTVEIKNLLKKLSIKYNADYINNSYYFLL